MVFLGWKSLLAIRIKREKPYVNLRRSVLDCIKSILDAQLQESPYLSLAMHDCKDNADNLRHVVDYLKKRGARFVTMTQLATEL